MADQRYQNHPLPPPPPSHSQGNQYAEESYDYRYQQQTQQQYPEPQQQYQQQQQQQPTSPVSPSYQQVQPPAQAHASAKQPAGPPQRQPSKQRTFSFNSNKSQKSNGSNQKTDNNHETHAEKEAKRLHSKADPTMAISEAEPATIQAMTKNSLAPLRSIQHRDSYGNAIAEPDRSNPTRSRWERPLDTIRSFEAAIDGGYSRKSFIRQDSDHSANNWNRRNSYYGNNGARFPQDSYYGSRPMSMIRSDSSHVDFGRGQRGSFYEGSQANGDSYTHSANGGPSGYGPGSSRQRTPRMMSEPMPAFREQREQQQIYPLPHKDRSYETVTTAAGSGSSDQAGYQTDPTSSDNSSVHRTSPPKRQEPVNDYGIGFNQSSSFQPAGFNVANGARNAGPSSQSQQRGPPPPPHGQMAPPQVPPKNGNVLLRKQVSPATRPEPVEKRKSWFSRRFSKTS
ncbi:hypothetical protein F5X68DRAFT_69783 [Plectosphaerella plurivora]|uniref:Uncharacterized protein n=1 Tax=Plectosphaerella plurivora TaxID=936078 RepID=A0A9P8VGW0_9PEZI|nr:hypothetical protein F5X68DRAFT_69783 [Plectosphaerella plurivora]